MKLQRIGQSGTTTSRQNFWDKVRDAVLAQQKIAGRNVTVDEHEGAGSVINVADVRRSTGGACCVDGECSVISSTACADASGNFLGGGSTCEGVDCTVGACCAEDGSCTLTTEEECAGTFEGYGSDCDPNPCPPPGTGACCVDGVCSIHSAIDCAGIGGNYQGDDTDCDPNPCEIGACCDCFGCEYPRTVDMCFGAWHSGAVCADVCPTGCCCEYVDGVFGACAATSESQCNTDCCDPPCPGFTMFWHSNIDDCIGCVGCPP